MAPSGTSQSAAAKAARSADGLAATAAEGVLGTRVSQRVFRQAKELHEEKLAEGMSGDDIFTELDAAFGAQMAAQRCATRARFTLAFRGGGAPPPAADKAAGPAQVNSASKRADCLHLLCGLIMQALGLAVSARVYLVRRETAVGGLLPGA